MNEASGVERGHSHSHSHGSTATLRRLVVALALSLTVVVAQVIGAVITDSLALLTDTVHGLADSVGLVVAVIAALLARRPRTARRTWGFTRGEILAALGQSVMLLLVGVYALVEGVRRLFNPHEVDDAVLAFGVIGLIANLLALYVLNSGKGESLNIRAASLEVLNDALGSLAVIAAALAMRFTDFRQADSIAALFIAVLILPRAARIAREATAILMEFAPEGVDLAEVESHILEIDHVEAVHDLHASTIGTGLPILTAHVVISDECFYTAHALKILDQIQECMAEHFPVSFSHTTIQLEPAAHDDHEDLGH